MKNRKQDQYFHAIDQYMQDHGAVVRRDADMVYEDGRVAAGHLCEFLAPATGGSVQVAREWGNRWLASNKDEFTRDILRGAVFFDGGKGEEGIPWLSVKVKCECNSIKPTPMLGAIGSVLFGIRQDRKGIWLAGEYGHDWLNAIAGLVPAPSVHRFQGSADKRVKIPEPPSGTTLTLVDDVGRVPPRGMWIGANVWAPTDPTTQALVFGAPPPPAKDCDCWIKVAWEACQAGDVAEGDVELGDLDEKKFLENEYELSENLVDVVMEDILNADFAAYARARFAKPRQVTLAQWKKLMRKTHGAEFQDCDDLLLACGAYTGGRRVCGWMKPIVRGLKRKAPR